MANKIGIMGAIPNEVAKLYELMVSARHEKIGGVDFYCGTLYGKEIVACCAGMGKANAAAATQLLATHFGVQAIIFNGIAGNMNSSLNVGDVVISNELLYHDAERRMIAESYPNQQVFYADKTLTEAAMQACFEHNIPFLHGRIATGDDFVGDKETKTAIFNKCQPDCVEMEGAAVAHIAAKNDIPCVVIRTLSDNAEEDVATLNAKEFDLNDYYSAALNICTGILQRI